ncbi:MAG: hypothetical protein AAB935_00540 [Patescibacteria group bacterium]
MKQSAIIKKMAKTSKDAYQHIAEWSEFFSDMSRCSEEAVNGFIAAYKKRKHLKQSLRRLIKRGFIEEKRKKFFVTTVGRKFFKLKASKNFDKKNWDGKWYLIGFDVPVKKDAKRDKLREVLKAYNFYPLQKSVWVGPNKFGSDIWEFIVENKLESYCKIMIVDVIEGDEELKKHFGLG